MRRLSSVVMAVVLSLAAAHAAGKPTKTLKDFLPDKLGDVKRERPLPPPPGFGAAPSNDAHGAYLLPERRFVNINLMWVKELSFEKAQFRVRAPGETKGDHEGFDVDGTFVQRTYFPRTKKSEVRALLANKIVVMLSVENAKTPNEALEWLPKMDLKSLAAFAREK